MIRREKIIEVGSLGPVLFVKSKRARHMSISVRPFKGVRVAVPRGCTYGMAMEFVLQKTAWIKKSLLKMLRVEEEQKERLMKSVEPTGAQRRAARSALLDRLDILSERHGFSYNRLFVRCQRTLWGSCSSRNNINLNMKLLELPEELCDYVILHELVHTRIKSHGPSFWEELNRYVPNAKRVDRELGKYSLVVA